MAAEEARDLGSIAFENGFDEIHPPQLFRVHSTRSWKERGIKHVNWFATLEAAEAHVGWLQDNERAKDITLAVYARIDPCKPS